jgi:hypothetical protein
MPTQVQEPPGHQTDFIKREIPHYILLKQEEERIVKEY